MMLSWANKQLEKLSETLAPPPQTTPHRFQQALRLSNTQLALSLLSPSPPPLPDGTPSLPLDPHERIHTTRGTLPIHCAAEHGNTEVVQALIERHGVSPHCFDLGGDTPLHYAARSTSLTSLDLVKMLVERYGADVCVRNAKGETAYDVGGKDGVRQYLLPKQLQKETQRCLDDGGRGLPQGIDLGGMRIAGGAAPMVAPPTLAGGGGDYNGAVIGVGSAPLGQHVSDPPVGLVPTAITHSPPCHTSSYQPDSSTATATSASTQPPPPTTTTVTSATTAIQINTTTTNTTNTSTTHRYAHSGSSSAAVLNKYRADGFHSSDNDISLQAKYGHYNHRPTNDLQPPPTHVDPSPPQGAGGGGGRVGEGGYNPYAGGYGSMGRRVARYPVYDAVSNTVGGAGWGGGSGGDGVGGGASDVAPRYAMFGVGSHTQTQTQTQIQTQPDPQQYAQPQNANAYYQNQPQSDTSGQGYYQGQSQPGTWDNHAIAQPPAVGAEQYGQYPMNPGQQTHQQQEPPPQQSTQAYGSYPTHTPSQTAVSVTTTTSAQPQQPTVSHPSSTEQPTYNDPAPLQTTTESFPPPTTTTVATVTQPSNDGGHATTAAVTIAQEPSVEPAPKSASDLFSTPPPTQTKTTTTVSTQEPAPIEPAPKSASDLFSTLPPLTQTTTQTAQEPASIEPAPKSASDLFAIPPLSQTINATVTDAVHPSASSASQLFATSTPATASTTNGIDTTISPTTNHTSAPEPSTHIPQNGISRGDIPRAPTSASELFGISSPPPTFDPQPTNNAVVSPSKNDSFLPPPPILSDLTRNVETELEDDGVVVPSMVGEGDSGGDDLPPPPPMMDVSF